MLSNCMKDVSEGQAGATSTAEATPSHEVKGLFPTSANYGRCGAPGGSTLDLSSGIFL